MPGVEVEDWVYVCRQVGGGGWVEVSGGSVGVLRLCETKAMSCSFYNV